MPRDLHFSPLIMPYVNALTVSMAAQGVATDPTTRIAIRPEEQVSLQGGQGNAINYPIIASLELLAASPGVMGNTSQLLYQVALGSCYETLKEHDLFKGKESVPEINFFRHIRNACFHGNKFHFEHGEPRSAAKWRGLLITAELEGKPLFWSFWKPADPLHLLADISQLVGDR